MPQEIYNEGRVVGLSAWELFVKQALGDGMSPEVIPNEQQWLTSMIGMGSSMILKISADTQAGVHDYPLPINSNLSAAGVIIANPFMGDCAWDSSTWATKVLSYSPLIQNDNNASPTSSNVPYGNNYSITTYQNIVSEFTKITDGIVFTQNANWINNGNGLPKKDIDPNFNESSTVVRLYISSDIKYDTAVLLTGFNNKRILQGLSGHAVEESGQSIGGSTDVAHNNWKDGGMLGPEIIPWASKIVFTLPSTVYNLSSSLNRAIPSDTTYTEGVKYGYVFKDIDTEIRPKSVIDFNSIALDDYYRIHSSEFSKSPTLQENVKDFALGINDICNEILAWYPGMSAQAIKSATSANQFFPPAIYASQVDASGSQTLVPLDVAAPGTVKGFNNSTQAYAYSQQMPDNYAIYKNPTTNMISFVINGEPDPTKWMGLSKLSYLSGDYPKVELTVGDTKTRLIALTDSNNTEYNLNGTSGNITIGPSGNLTWANMLTALKTNKSLDILGTKLHNFATELNSTNKIGIANTVTETGSAKFTITGSNSASMTATAHNGTPLITASNNASYKSGTNFIEFSNGLRLYIQTGTAPDPTNVPVGSIGIGW